MSRKCTRCGTLLNRYHLGRLCYPCQEKELEKRESEYVEELHYDAEAVATILGLKNAASVKQLARKGKLPDRVPGVKKYLWFKVVFDAWVKSEHHVSPSSSEEAEAILTALKLGWPIDQMTLYGYDPGNLIAELKKFGYLQDRKNQSQ